MAVVTYLWHLLQYAFCNPDNPVLSTITWLASIWALLMWGVPRISKLSFVQSLSNKIGKWRLPIFILLIFASLIAAAYSIQSSFISQQEQNRPIVIFDTQNSKLTFADDNTTATIDLQVKNTGFNPAYNVSSLVCWAPESNLQNIWWQESSSVNPLLRFGAITLSVEVLRNGSDRWYLYYLTKYTDAANKGTQYADEYWYSLDFTIQRLSALSPAQKLEFQPHINAFLAKHAM